MSSLDDPTPAPVPNLVPGSAVMLAAGGQSHRNAVPAQLVAIDEWTMTVSPAPSVEPGGTCLVFVGEVGGRTVGRCTVDSVAGAYAVLRVPAEWKPVDARAHRRIQTRLRTDVRSETSGDEFFGVTVDVSMGGMAVEVLDDPAVDRISVCAGLREELEYLPCEVVDRHERNGVTVLHLRFCEMNAGQAEHVRQLIEDIEREIAA